MQNELFYCRLLVILSLLVIPIQSADNDVTVRPSEEQYYQQVEKPSYNYPEYAPSYTEFDYRAKTEGERQERHECVDTPGVKRNKKEIKKTQDALPHAEMVRQNKIIMKELNQGIDGFKIKPCEKEDILTKGGEPTYGEITYDGMQEILDDLQLGANDSFMDLGCGVGKVVVQVRLNTRVKRSAGVELCKGRWLDSKEVVRRMKGKNLLANCGEINFKFQDILRANLRGVTVAYMCSTCFSDDLMMKIMLKLSHLEPGARVLTLRKFPANYAAHGFEFVKKYDVPMTWAPEGSPVYMYKLIA